MGGYQMTEEYKKKLASQITAPEPAAELGGNDKFQNKLGNFWFYNKYKVYAGIFILIVMIVTISQCMSNKKADISILFITNFSMTDQQTTALQKGLAEYTTDRDKNGEVYVSISPISIGSSVDQQMSYAGQQKLMAEITTGDSLVYLINDEQYQSLAKQNAFENIKKLYPNVPGIEDYRISWKDLAIRKLPALKDLPDDLYFVMRTVSGTLDKDKNKVSYVNASKDFLKKIISAQ